MDWFLTLKVATNMRELGRYWVVIVELPEHA